MTWLEAVLMGGAVLAADQLSKHYALAKPRQADPAARPLVSFQQIINRRGALVPLGRPLRLATFALCAVFALVALTQDPLARSALGAAGIGMVLGGVTGNYLDLLRRNGIVDFIVVWRLPVFNVADVAIAAGLALVVWSLV